MSAEHIEDETLQQLHDGELDVALLEATRTHLADCTTCEGRARSLSRLQGMLRVASEEIGAGLESDALFARISEGLARQGSEPDAAPRLAEPAGSWLSRMLGSGGWMPAAGVMAAAAAAVLLTLYQPIEPESLQDPVEPLPSSDTPEPPGVPQPAVAPAIPGAQGSPAAARSEVVEVDFGHHTGTVFEIDMDDGTSTPVVWINDDSGE